MLNYILEITEKIVKETQKLSQKDKENIYNQVSYAIRQTKAHINSTRNERRDKASPTLSVIWQRTSINIKTINNRRVKELAQIIEEKSKYWADPDTYDLSLIDSYNLRLSQVESTIENICR